MTRRTLAQNRGDRAAAFRRDETLRPYFALLIVAPLRSFVKPIERGLLCLQPNVRIVLEHPPREMARDRLDHVVRFAGFEEPGDDRVPQVVEPKARQAGCIAQRTPCRVPLPTPFAPV